MNQQQREDLERQLDELERAMDDVWRAENLIEAMKRHRETQERMEWIRLQIAAINTGKDAKH